MTNLEYMEQYGEDPNYHPVVCDECEQEIPEGEPYYTFDGILCKCCTKKWLEGWKRLA